MALSVRYERDGLVLPRAIGGDSVVDLVNTFAGWDRPSAASAREYLQSYDHLVLWSVSAGLVTDAGVDATEELHRGGHCREAKQLTIGLLAGMRCLTPMMLNISLVEPSNPREWGGSLGRYRLV